MAGFVSDTLRLVQSPGQSSVPGLGQEESGEETEQTGPSEHRLRQPVHLVHLPQPGDVGDGEHPQGPDHVAEAETESPDLGGEQSLKTNSSISRSSQEECEKNNIS